MKPFLPLKVSHHTAGFLKECLALFSPFLLWIFLVRGFFLQELGLGGTAPAYYLRIKYFLDSMAGCVYPLWNPFVAWGSPDLLDMRTMGEFNPFLYLISFFKFLGVPDYSSYLCYLAVYYFIGLLGFYLLAKHLSKDRRIAWVAYVLLLFSSLSPTLFSENVLPYMFVPGVWFFLFLVCFIEQPRRESLAGMTFCLMILATTYIPFNFLTIFLCFFISFLIVGGRKVKESLAQFINGLARFKITTLLCALSLILSLIPGWLWHQAANGGEYLIDFRHAGAPDQDFLSMPFGFVNQSGIASMAWQDLFAGLKHTAGLSTIFFYIPYFLYLVILLSVINRANKKLRLLFLTGFLVFLITLTSVTPLYRFLYDHVFFFRTFRNLFFLLYLIIPVIILFATEQLRIFLAVKPNSFKLKLALSFWIILCHLLFAVFLLSQEEVLRSAFITVIASLAFFMLNLWMKNFRRKNILFATLLAFALLSEPVELYGKMFFDWKGFKGFISYPVSERQAPQFSFSRPRKEQDILVDQTAGYAGIKKAMQDTSGFVEKEFIGTKWSCLLQNQIDPRILQEYVRNKFMVYDHVQKMEASRPDFKQLESAFASKANTAFVFSAAGLNSPSTTSVQPQYQVIPGDSPQFQVVAFGLNFIKFKTNFPTAKFLVYNDSYHAGWHGFVNGKKVPLWQANIAFKGLWLGPGENSVTLRYESLGLYYIYLFLAGHFFLFFFYLLILFYQANFKNKVSLCD